MKRATPFVRFIVGLLFIFSGLIKANDPLGLSYKMQEFFDLWKMTRFNEHTLWLSVVLIAFEIIAGAALLLGWRMKLIVWLLLLLTVFFTFLTGYAYLSGQFKNCGCFGDCLPITPLTSFIKDIVLTILILFLFVNRARIRPLFGNRVTTAVFAGIVVLSFLIQWYTLNYLPVFDCLAYRKGNNIPEQQKMPANAIPDSTVITFVYKKAGAQIEFTADKFPADFNDSIYTFVSRYDKIIRKGSNNEPPIKGFALSGVTGADSTTVVLSQPYAVVLFAEDFSTPVSKWKDDFARLYTAAISKRIPVYAVTNRGDEAVRQFAQLPFPAIQLFTCDYTAIRTAARVNPTIYFLKAGTIVDKQSYRRMDKIRQALEAIPIQSPAGINP
ncbi:MAG TPA: BT_3928 family protein [Chitinophagaceae bacterium]|nr:BT_3928 family protein [Chitinophagaceae bacterium]